MFRKFKFTSQKIIFEKEKGLFKKERELIDILPLETVKVYNDAAQVKQKGDTVEVQTVDKNIAIVFSGMLEARKFTGKIVDAVTGTTLARRSSDKIRTGMTEIIPVPKNCELLFYRQRPSRCLFYPLRGIRREP